MQELEKVEQEELDLSRQSRLVPKDKVSQWNLKVFGVGSIGSHFVETAAKTGFKNIEIYDMDIVESENIAAQAFHMSHIGMRKVDAMIELIEKATGASIAGNHGMVDQTSDIEAEPNTIYCCFFDSFEARQMLFDKLKDYPVIFVDGRIGRYDMRHYLVDMSNDKQKEVYAKSLQTKAVSELECGEKACAPINKIISGKILMNIVNYINEKDYEKMYIGNAATPKMSMHITEERESVQDEL